MSHKAIILAALIVLPGAGLAQQASIMTLTDQADAVPGLATVRPCDAPPPPENSTCGEIPQMPGWPITIGGAANFAPSRGLVFADLDGDGDLEVIASSTDSRVYAWDYTGAALPGFPVSTIGMAQYAPSIGDIDNDGDPEIVQCTRGPTSGGRLYVIDHQGNVVPPFPISINNNNVAACPSLHDLDNDGQLEIIVGERDYPIGYLHIFEPDGSEWTDGWPVELDHVPTGTAAVGDVDVDGQLEIFYLSYNSMYLLELDGTTLEGWPQQIPNANFSYQSAALADLDGDEDLEIVVGAHKNAAGCYVFHHDCTPFPGWPKLVGTWTYCPPTVTDLEGDGELEILDGRAGVFGDPHSAAFWAWTTGGQIKPGFPYIPPHGDGGGSDGPLTVADVNGDGRMEIFADHNIAHGEQGWLFGVDSAGNDLPGFPLRPRGFTYMNGAAIADVDRDGDYELGVLSSHDYGVDVNLYDLPYPYGGMIADWKVYHARNTRGGLYVPCPGDLDGDRDIDLADLAQLLSNYGMPGGAIYADGDLDHDGAVDLSDLAALLAVYGTTCP